MSDFFESPIFVLGLPRSGTSLIAGLLTECGAWSGSTVEGSESNPKGFFEHIMLREAVTKLILSKLKVDTLGVKTLPKLDSSYRIPGLAKAIRAILTEDGYDFDRPWLYKDPKLTLLWPIYKNAFPGATWIIVTRDREGFVQSCIRTGFMSQHSSDPQFWENYAVEYESRLESLRATGAKVFEIYSPDVIAGKFDSLKKLIEVLGLGYDEKVVKEFVNPEFWHAGESS